MSETPTKDDLNTIDIKLTKPELANISQNAAVPLAEVETALRDCCKELLPQLQSKRQMFTFNILQRYALRSLIRSGYVKKDEQEAAIRAIKRDDAVFKGLVDVLTFCATCEERVELINATKKFLKDTAEYKVLVKEAVKTIYKWSASETDPTLKTDADAALKKTFDETLVKVAEQGIRKPKKCLEARLVHVLKVVTPRVSFS